MRFFTHEWALLEGPDANAVYTAYERVIRTASDKLGIRLEDFVREFDLRGSLVDRISSSKSCDDLRLELVIGDNQRGYSALHLSYLGGQITYSGDSLIEALDARSTRIRFDEFDLEAGDKLHHRFLLWPKQRGEMEISCVGFSWEVWRLSSRAYQNFGEIVQLNEQ